MHTLSHHEWKLVYTAVRKAQKQLNYDSLSYASEYEEYHHILNKLYPLAYSETYDASTSIPGKPIPNDDEYNIAKGPADPDVFGFNIEC